MLQDFQIIMTVLLFLDQVLLSIRSKSHHKILFMIRIVNTVAHKKRIILKHSKGRMVTSLLNFQQHFTQILAITIKDYKNLRLLLSSFHKLFRTSAHLQINLFSVIQSKISSIPLQGLAKFTLLSNTS